MKKILSIILSVMMIATMAVGVFAADAPTDPKQIVDEAYALEQGTDLPYTASLTGVVTGIKDAYNSQYENISLYISVEGNTVGTKELLCYRIKGEDAATVAVNDKITVTGVITNYNGTIEFKAGSTFVTVSKGSAPEAPSDPKQIVDEAYALEQGAALPYKATLTGEIVSVDTPYSADYKNITVTIAVEGKEDKPIQCFRLKGDGADTLAVGDTITVTGTIKNYNGTIEFDAGCTLDAVVKGEVEAPEAPEDPKEIVDAAYALEEGAALPYEAVLTGVIVSVDTPYSADYKNITVTIAVEGKEDKPIQCFRLKGDGADTLAVGDTITVTGVIKNYNGTVEYDSGCTFVLESKGEAGPPVTDAPQTGVAAAILAVVAVLSGGYIVTKKH